jgi:hypothetical protein
VARSLEGVRRWWGEGVEGVVEYVVWRGKDMRYMDCRGWVESFRDVLKPSGGEVEDGVFWSW